jgi:hypothetical protein
VFCAEALELAPDSFAHGYRIGGASDTGSFGPGELGVLSVELRDIQLVGLETV